MGCAFNANYLYTLAVMSNARGKVNHASEVIYQAYHSRIRRSALLLRLEEKKRIGEKKLVESKSFC